jgi:tRNA uracil 4-sulfurtransferase
VFERVCLVHFHELGLKGRNRAQFERRLRENIEAALVGFPVAGVERIASRVLVVVEDPERVAEVARRVAVLPGVQSISVGYRTAREPAQMEQAALLAIRDAGAFSTFRIEARRSNTDYPEPSVEINRRIGASVQRETGAAVDLTSPDVTVRVSVVQGSVYVSSAEIPGIGGLPAGISGRVVSLLSAGIDSPVASWRLLRRGAMVIGVHFSGRPQTNDSSERLVREIGERLALTGGLARIYIAPFGDLQREISLESPPDLRVLLYRRLMVRVAEEIARAEHAKALVTGESLGQVASQTLENIAAIDEVATLPILRPLVGSDKLEIIDDARRIGTYEISTTDHIDCCTLFMPRTPETHARLAEVVEAWESLPHERMVHDALASVSWSDFGARGYRPPKAWPTAGDGTQRKAGLAPDDGARP